MTVSRGNIDWTRGFLIFVFMICMLLITVSSITAEDMKVDEDIYILEAENISYGYQQKLISADGGVRFRFKDLQVKAEKFVLDMEKDMLTAEGDNVLLITETEEISGNYLEYNYETGRGTLYGASSHIDDLNFKGGVIELRPGRDYQYYIEQAQLTPCILPEPHYQIKAESIQIYPGDKILGEEVQFWWGDRRLITLPYYVMKYIKIIGEDGKEREIIVNPIPLPRLGFDSRQGLIFSLIYPYYLGERSSGEITASSSQQGGQAVSINNTYYINDNTLVENELKYEKVEEDDIWQQNTDYHGYLKFNRPYYEIYTGLHYQKEEAVDSSENGSPTAEKKLLAVGVNYKKGNLSFKPQAAYNIDSGAREEEIEVNYKVGSAYRFNLFHQYLNENLEKYSYSVNSKNLFLNWNLTYRDGYKIDYYPYLTLDLPSVYDLSTVIGIGKVGNEGAILNKAQVKVDYAKSFKITEAVTLDFSEKFIYNLYEHPLSAATSQVFVSDISGHYQRQITEDVDLGLKLYWQQTAADGDFLLKADQVGEKSILGSDIDVDIAAPEPQSKWSLNGGLKYDLEEEGWHTISLGITREFDCYSLSFNYNYVTQSFGFNFEI